MHFQVHTLRNSCKQDTHLNELIWSICKKANIYILQVCLIVCVFVKRSSIDGCWLRAIYSSEYFIVCGAVKCADAHLEMQHWFTRFNTYHS